MSGDRRRFRVRGRVQGVGFRWWTAEQARELGLAGVVRNEPDGSVLVEAEGEEGAIAALRARLASGPPAARVEAVDELAPSAATLPNPFRIGH